MSILKKIRQKLLNPVLAQNDIIKELIINTSEKNARISEGLYGDIGKMETAVKNLCLEFEEANKNQVEDILKAKIASRWETYDRVDEERFADYHFKCKICGDDIYTKTAKKHTSNCIFFGGELNRYECPNCDTIIGPLKMMGLSKADFDRDYTEHYSVYQEGDTTEDEKFTFYKLNPSKEKTYLNYGSGGGWSRSIKELREEGYDVYGYEPYASDESAEYTISSKEEVVKMKFDGIFSNNVLEHMRTPLEDFKFMKSLLKDKNSIMIHSTPCYVYSYEYTRFHLFFYAGKSVEYISKACGLEAYDKYEAIRNNNLYMSYTFKAI